MDQANGYRGGHESHVRPENGSLPNSSLLLGFESLGECSKTRRHWSRDGVMLVLQGLPNCCERNVSVATGIYFALRGIGNDVSTYPVVDPISSGGEMRHGPLPASPPPVPRSLNPMRGLSVGFPTRKNTRPWAVVCVRIGTRRKVMPAGSAIFSSARKSEGTPARRFCGDRNIGPTGGEVVEMGGTRCGPRAKPHGKRPSGAQLWPKKQTIPKNANIMNACGMRGPHWQKGASPSMFPTSRVRRNRRSQAYENPARALLKLKGGVSGTLLGRVPPNCFLC